MWDQVLKSKARAMRDFSTDDILSALGLERRRTAYDVALPTTLAFVAGAAAGAGIALLLAPKTGREMRQEISTRAGELRQDLSNRAAEFTRSLSSSASELADEARAALPSSQLSEERRAERALSGTNRSSS
jgi:hypothetical protein